MNHQTSSAPTPSSSFEWRAPLGPWRWLILGTLGVAPSACGGRTEGADIDRDAAELEGRAGARATEQAPSAGGASSASTSGFVVPGSAGSVASGGGVPSVPSECVLASELGGNWEQCENGMIHRREPGTCTSSLPRADYSIAGLYGLTGPDAGAEYACNVDTDCNARPHGHCALGQSGPYCDYGCLTDADCDAGTVCLCGATIGACIAAECGVDADCGGSSLCGSYERQPSCGGIRFGCQTPADQCAGNKDCGESGYCIREYEYSDDGTGNGIEAPNRSCATTFCIVGRPFLIDGAERLAASAARPDWYPSGLTAAAAAEAGGASSAAIARGWTEQALMEHASVASFARFALQLLQLGAPAELVERASAAMQDEIRHARACFGLARRHSTEDIGPGPLAIDGALERMDPASIVLDALSEGCIGETVAAIEAAEALSHCEDPAARAVLERIALEEGKHAELAWRFVAWAIETRPELFERVREAFGRELAGVRRDGARGLRDASAADCELARHGLLSARLRAALRQRVLANIIAPCSEALLDGAGWQRPDSRRVVRRTPHAA